MFNSVDEKINEIVGHILEKPTEEITLSDYKILKSEQSDYRFREREEKQNERFQNLLGLMGCTSYVPHGGECVN